MLRIVLSGVLVGLLAGGCPDSSSSLGSGGDESDRTPPPGDSPDGSGGDGAAASETIVASPMDGNWIMAGVESGEIACITISGGQVVASDRGCDGFAEPIYGTTCITLSDDAAAVSWQFRFPGSRAYRRQVLDLTRGSDGTYSGTATFFYVDEISGNLIGHPLTEPVTLTRQD